MRRFTYLLNRLYVFHGKDYFFNYLLTYRTSSGPFGVCLWSVGPHESKHRWFILKIIAFASWPKYDNDVGCMK